MPETLLIRVSGSLGLGGQRTSFSQGSLRGLHFPAGPAETAGLGELAASVAALAAFAAGSPPDSAIWSGAPCHAAGGFP